MKKIVIFIALLGTLTACAQMQTTSTASVGMANPASVWCKEQGGQLEIQKNAQGDVGYCHLPSGEVIEEWEYFHRQQAKCQSEALQDLIGKTNLTEAEIQLQTKAKLVRIVEPSQPVTMDYREDRVTVVIDPTTKNIVHASCG